MVEGQENVSEEGEFKYTDLLLRSAVVVVILSAAVVLLVPQYKSDLILMLVGLFMGVVSAFYLYHSFTEPPRELLLPPGEEVLKKNVDGGVYLTVPMSRGGFIGKQHPTPVNLYLTNQALIAEPRDLSMFDEEGRYYVYNIPLSTIMNFFPEKKLFAEYIRMTFTNKDGADQELLIHTAEETGEWMDALSRLFS